MNGARQLALAFLSRDLAGVWIAGGTFGDRRGGGVAKRGLAGDRGRGRRRSGPLAVAGDAAVISSPVEEGTHPSPAARRAGQGPGPPRSRAGRRRGRGAAACRLDARRTCRRSGASSPAPRIAQGGAFDPDRPTGDRLERPGTVPAHDRPRGRRGAGRSRRRRRGRALRVRRPLVRRPALRGGGATAPRKRRGAALAGRDAAGHDRLRPADSRSGRA